MAENYFRHARSLLSAVLTSRWLLDSVRTSLAAAASLAFARLFKMPEAYWAPVTTIITTQSTLGAAWNVSKLRLVGTALGAATGALLASYFNPGIVVLGAGVFVLGLICAVLRLDQSAYRFAGVALAIIVLITRAQSPWITGMHRFVEVSIGIVVGLVFSGIGPGQKSQESRA